MMRRAQPWLGTLVEISSDGPQQGITLAFAELALVQRLMSFHDSDSDISRFNRAAPGRWLEVHPHTWQVLALATRVAQLSEGYFNVACAPQLVDWACLPAPVSASASASTSTSTAQHPVYQPGLAVYRCESGWRLQKLADGWIDVGGIAKGYAVDLAVQALRQGGASAGCVNAGGDLRGFGEQCWPVALRDPQAPRRAAHQMTIRNQALATSASYFSARWHAGRQISALLDGRSGAPLITARSVSVLAPDCAAADALTKVVLASGDSGHAALAAFGATAFII